MFDNKLFCCAAKRPAVKKKAVDSLKEVVHKLRVTLASAKVALIDVACAEGSVAAVTQSAGMRFRTRPQVRLFSTSAREKKQATVCATDAFSTKAISVSYKGKVCSAPSTSCALTTTDTGHKSGLNYVRHGETVQQRNPFFFFFLFFT